VDFAYDGGGLGKGGTITMTANGRKIAEGRLERTVPVNSPSPMDSTSAWMSVRR